MARNNLRPVAGVLVGVALCFSSTAAAAASIPAAPAPMSISPFVALSAYGTMQSRDAVCATAVGAAGAAAAEGQAPAQGCVLPQLDPAPVAVETAPVAPVAVAPAPAFGLGIGALIAGLALVAGLAAVLLRNDDGNLPIGDGGLLPISPS